MLSEIQGTITRNGRRHLAVQYADGSIDYCDNPIGYRGQMPDTWRKAQRRLAVTFTPDQLSFSGKAESR